MNTYVRLFLRKFGRLPKDKKELAKFILLGEKM